MTPRQGSIGGGTVTQGVASLCPGLREVAPLGLKTECAKADQPVLRTSPEEWCCAVSPVTLATRHREIEDEDDDEKGPLDTRHSPPVPWARTWFEIPPVGR